MNSEKEFMIIRNSSHSDSNRMTIEHHVTSKSSQGSSKLKSLTSSNKEEEVLVNENSKDSLESQKEVIKLTIGDENDSMQDSTKELHNDMSISAKEVDLQSHISSLRVLVDRSVGSTHNDPAILSDDSVADESDRDIVISRKSNITNMSNHSNKSDSRISEHGKKPFTTEVSNGSIKEELIEISIGSDKESSKKQEIESEPTPEKDSNGSRKDELESEKESDHIILIADYQTSDNDFSAKEDKYSTSSNGSRKEQYISKSSSSKDNALSSYNHSSKETHTSKDAGIQISIKSNSDYDHESLDHSEKESLMEQSESEHEPEIIIAEESSYGSEKESAKERISTHSSKELEKSYSSEHDKSSGKSELIVQLEASEPEQSEFNDSDKEILRISERRPQTSSQNKSKSKFSQETISTSEQEKYLHVVEEFDDSSKDHLPIENTYEEYEKQSENEIAYMTETDNSSKKEIMVEELSSDSSKQIFMPQNHSSLFASSKDVKSDSRHSSKISELSSGKCSSKEVLVQDMSSGSLSNLDNSKNLRASTSKGSRKENLIDFSPEDDLKYSDNGDSDKECEISIEYSNGSLKEEIEEKSDDSEKEQYLTSRATSINDGEIEEKESSKQSIRLLNENMSDYHATIEEESEKEDEHSSIQRQTLSSHFEQPSESEREPTPKNKDLPDYMIPKLRENTIKVSNLLKRNPKSIVFYPKMFTETREAIKNPNSRYNQKLHDYGDPTMASTHKEGGRSETLNPNRRIKPNYIRSMEELPQNTLGNEHSNLLDNAYDDLRHSVDGDHLPHSTPARNVLLSDHPFNKPTATGDFNSGESINSWMRLPSNSRYMIDWSETPIFSEYKETGFTRYNEEERKALLSEDEVPQLFALLKTRYSTTTNTKVEPFFHKCMDTLGEILGSFLHHHLFRAIQQMYSKADTQNTLKLLLRVKGLFDARYTIFQIFHDILEFKKLSKRIQTVLKTSKDYLIDKSYNLMSKTLEELHKINSSLQDQFENLQRDHKQL